MGKGDKKTKKGKIAIGSFGNSRKRSSATAKGTKSASKKTEEQLSGGETPAKAKKVARKKSEG
jgi:30S ribosomal protein S31